MPQLCFSSFVSFLLFRNTLPFTRWLMTPPTNTLTNTYTHMFACIPLSPLYRLKRIVCDYNLRLCWMEKHSTTYHSSFSFHFSVWSVFAVSKRVSRTNSITNVLTNVNKTQQGIYKKRIKQNVW